MLRNYAIELDEVKINLEGSIGKDWYKSLDIRVEIVNQLQETKKILDANSNIKEAAELKTEVLEAVRDIMYTANVSMLANIGSKERLNSLKTVLQTAKTLYADVTNIVASNSVDTDK